MNGVDKTKRTHDVQIRARKEMTVSGVDEVLSFDEVGVRLRSAEGEMSVEGEELRIDVLDTERGVVEIKGKIDGLFYVADKNEKKGFFSRLGR